VSDQSRDAAKSAASGGGGRGRRDNDRATITSELRDTIREAAVEVLKPVAQSATRAAAKYAVTKGPELLRDRVVPKVAEAGGAGELAKSLTGKGGGLMESLSNGAKGLAEKLPTASGKDPKSFAQRRLPIMESVDVGVDLETAYDQFTQFEDWPEFMQHTEDVRQLDDATLRFAEGVWGLRQRWQADIVEETPCQRIVLRGDDDAETVCVVTFHRLGENLTRVQVAVDSQPQGAMQRFAPGARMTRRALRSDLRHFKAFLEMRDEPTGAWRGQIEEGEVVDDDGADEPRDAEEVEEPRAEDEDEEPYDEEPEDEAPEDEEPEDEAPEDEEPEDEAPEDEEPYDEEPEDEAPEDEEPEDEAPEDYEDEEPEDYEDEEPEDEAPEDYEDEEPRAEDEDREEPQDEEEDEAPPAKPRAPRRRRSAVKKPTAKKTTPRKTTAKKTTAKKTAVKKSAEDEQPEEPQRPRRRRRPKAAATAGRRG
jgi:uncharacterized membrane protein